MIFDELLTNHVGELGRYQVIVILIVCFEEIIIGLHIMSPVFTAATPEHHCKHPEISLLENCSETFQKAWAVGDVLGQCSMLAGNLSQQLAPNITGFDYDCSEDNISAIEVPDYWLNSTRENCDEWIYDDEYYTETMVTEWSLVCDRAYMTKAISSTFLGGMMFGYYLFGWLSDRYGRRKAIFIAGIPNLVIGIIQAFNPNYYAFLVLRFFHGTFACGKTTIGFVMALEYSGPSKRQYIGPLYFIFWTLGYAGVAGIAYFCKNWRTVTMIITFPEILYYILLYFFVPESPRWLYAVGRKTEGDEIVEKMAKFNKKELPKNLNIYEPKRTNKMSPADLFRTPQIRKVTFLILFVWAANGLTYYGLSLNTSALYGDPYINHVIGALVEIPANLYIMVAFTYLGRLIPFSLSMFASGMSLLLTLAVPEEHGVAATALVMVGKFFITASFNMTYMYISEVYPTRIRMCGLSYTNVASKLAAPIAPYVTLLAVLHPSVPITVYGGVAVVAGILLLFMPETKGLPLVQTIEEGEIMIKQNTYRMCRRQKQQNRCHDENGIHKEPEEVDKCLLNGDHEMHKPSMEI